MAFIVYTTTIHMRSRKLSIGKPSSQNIPNITYTYSILNSRPISPLKTIMPHAKEFSRSLCVVKSFNLSHHLPKISNTGINKQGYPSIISQMYSCKQNFSSGWLSMAGFIHSRSAKRSAGFTRLPSYIQGLALLHAC